MLFEGNIRNMGLKNSVATILKTSNHLSSSLIDYYIS